MRKLAIVGSGIAGLGLAYFLRDDFEITIFEKQNRFGGHSNTVTIPEGGLEIAIDTGFMVFNHVTYPLLTALFEELSVPTNKTDMSFSVQHKTSGIEYAGASFNRLFGDRRNLLKPKFWRMLVQLDRFNREAALLVQDPAYDFLTVHEFVRRGRFGDDFLNWYLIPMASAIWSTPPGKILSFPAKTLVSFFDNHGFLGMDTQHQWWTVTGGSRQYVKRLMSKLSAVSHLRADVTMVRPDRKGAQVITSDGTRRHFDAVALACHADESLQMLASPSPSEREILSAFAYQSNLAQIHTDKSVMPAAKPCWASWNYRAEFGASTTHYWMNSLQNVSEKRDYFVSLNSERIIDKRRVLYTIEYHHPTFDLNAIAQQKRLPELNASAQRIFFCGSYFGHGFHEDALKSAFDLAQILRGSMVCA